MNFLLLGVIVEWFWIFDNILAVHGWKITPKYFWLYWQFSMHLIPKKVWSKNQNEKNKTDLTLLFLLHGKRCFVPQIAASLFTSQPFKWHDKTTLCWTVLFYNLFKYLMQMGLHNVPVPDLFKCLCRLKQSHVAECWLVRCREHGKEVKIQKGIIHTASEKSYKKRKICQNFLCYVENRRPNLCQWY